jgi:hypothetical protein
VRKRYSLTLIVDLDNQAPVGSAKLLMEQELKGLTLEELTNRLKDEGFVHSDGKVRKCAPPPEGFVLYGVLKDYYAIPKGEFVSSPERDQPLYECMPKRSLRWVGNEWVLANKEKVSEPSDVKVEVMKVQEFIMAMTKL